MINKQATERLRATNTSNRCTTSFLIKIIYGLQSIGGFPIFRMGEHVGLWFLSQTCRGFGQSLKTGQNDKKNVCFRFDLKS